MELLHFTTCLNTSSLINLSGHQRMQQGFCPMGRHLCQVAQTSTLKKNGWFSITVIFLWTYKKKKKYELSSSDFDFHISEVSLSGKKKKSELRTSFTPYALAEAHPTTYTCPAPDTFHSAASPRATEAPFLGGLCWQLSDHQQAVPKPTNSSGSPDQPTALLLPWGRPKFPRGISPWLCLVEFPVLCSPWKSSFIYQNG